MPTANVLTRGGGWAAALLLCALLLAGCQAGGGVTHTVQNATPFYLDGPQQARPPDSTLAAGTRVTLISTAGSYAQIVLPDGRRGYVAAESLQSLR